VTINAGCEAGASGETTLAINFALAQATTFIGSVTRDGGTDPDAPTVTEVENFEVPLPAGAVPVGGPSSPDGEFVREFARVLFVMPARTVSPRRLLDRRWHRGPVLVQRRGGAGVGAVSGFPVLRLPS